MKKEIYLKLRKTSLRYAYFLYFDTPEYLADQLFIKQQVRVWFDKEYAMEGSPILLILCHVRKKDSTKFLAALDALTNKMLLCGCPEYEAEVQKFMCLLEKSKGTASDSENDTSREAEQAGTEEILCR